MVEFVWLGLSLLVAHFAGDYFLQKGLKEILKLLNTRYDKKSNMWHLTIHCTTYLLFFILVFRWYGISFWWMAPLFVSHWLIDNEALIKKRTMAKSNRALGVWQRFLQFDVGLISDQVLHGLPLLAILLIGG